LCCEYAEPELPRTFKTPLVWVVAPLGALSALYLMWFLPWRTWERLIIWFVIGMVIYFVYGASAVNWRDHVCRPDTGSDKKLLPNLTIRLMSNQLPASQTNRRVSEASPRVRRASCALSI